MRCHLLTSEAWRTLAVVAVGCVDAPAVVAGRRQTLIHVLITQRPRSALGADAEVLAATGWKVNISDTLASVLASAWLHDNLASTHTILQPDFFGAGLL